MELLGKIKIHELAKEIGMASKDVLEKAKSLGIDVSSHLSNVTDEQATEIRNASIPLGVPTDLQSGVKKGSTY